MKTILPLTLLLILFSCKGKQEITVIDSETNENDIWIFPISASYNQAKELLTENRYEYIEGEMTLGDNQIQTLASDKYVINFADMDWSMYNLIFVNGNLTELDFNRYDGKQPTQNDINNTVRWLDREYGESRQSRDDLQHATSWNWIKDDVYVRFTTAKAVQENDALTLVFNIGDPEETKKQLGL